MFALRCGLIVCLCLFLFTAASSAICPQYLSSTLWGQVNSVAADDQYVYLSMVNGLVVLDYTDPLGPVEVGRLELPGKEGRIKLANGVAYICTRQAGLYIIDIDDPAAPAILGFYENEDVDLGFDVTARYAYLPNFYSSHVLALDISDPANPVVAGDHDIGCCIAEILVDGDYTYVIGGDHGLRIYRIDGAAPPVLAGNFNAIYNGHDIFIQDQTAYLLDYSGGEKAPRGDTRLIILDITNPEKPEPLCYYSDFGDQATVVVAGDYAYLSDLTEDQGVLVLDVSDPAQPVQVASVPNVERPWEIVIQGDRAFAAQSYRGLSAIDIADPHAPEVEWSWREGGLITDVWLDGDYAYIADRLDGLWVVDVSDITAPRIIKEIYLAGTPQAIVGEGDYLYISAAEGGLHIMDKTIPDDPVAVVTVPDVNNEIIKVASLGYAACDAEGLRIYDLSDPAAPVMISQLPVPGYAEGLAISGNILCVAASLGGLQFIDVTDPVNPQIVGAYVPGALFFHVAIMDHYAVSPNSSYGLHVVDFSDPANPVLTSQIDQDGNPHGIELEGDLAYVMRRYNRGINVIDLSDPANPVEVCECPTDGSAMHIFIRDELIYVADTYSLTILIDQFAAIDDPAQAAFDGPQLRYPNPVFADTRLYLSNLNSRACRVDLLDVAGRLQKTLYQGHPNQGVLDFNWRLGTEPSGTYYLRVVTDRFQVTRPVILIR